MKATLVRFLRACVGLEKLTELQAQLRKQELVLPRDLLIEQGVEVWNTLQGISEKLSINTRGSQILLQWCLLEAEPGT